MTAANDNDEPSQGASYAFAPLYILSTQAWCPLCSYPKRVYALGCAAFLDAEESQRIEQFHFLHLITSLPEPVIFLVLSGCPGFFFDSEAGDFAPYLMNHCPCGARLDDDYLHGDVGAPFWPAAPEGFRQIKLALLPVDEPTPVKSGYMLGGGEYLDYQSAEPWPFSANKAVEGT